MIAAHRGHVTVDGVAGGWIRVRLARPAPTVYDAALPAAVDDALAAAAVVVLDGEVGWIAEHAAAEPEGSQEE